MKKVRFLTSVSTTDRSYGGGEEASLNGTLADQWAACGFVEIIAAPVLAPAAPVAPHALPVETETATATPAVENAAIAPKPSRKRR